MKSGWTAPFERAHRVVPQRLAPVKRPQVEQRAGQVHLRQHRALQPARVARLPFRRACDKERAIEREIAPVLIVAPGKRLGHALVAGLKLPAVRSETPREARASPAPTRGRRSPSRRHPRTARRRVLQDELCELLFWEAVEHDVAQRPRRVQAVRCTGKALDAQHVSRAAHVSPSVTLRTISAWSAPLSRLP